MSASPRSISSALVLHAVLAFVAAGTAPAAHAGGNLMPASGCQAVNGKGAEHIRHMAWGIINTSSEPINVVCPVVRPSSTGASMYINGSVNANMTMGCVLLSSSYNGSISATTSFVVTGSANISATKFDKHLKLSDEDAPYYSYQTLYCDLPADRKGSLRGYMVFTD